MKNKTITALTLIALTGTAITVVDDVQPQVVQASAKKKAKKDGKVSKKIFNQAVEDTYEFLETDSMIEDAYIERKGKKITIAIIVNPATNDDHMEDVADTALRQLNTNASINGANLTSSAKDTWGGLYNYYKVNIGVGTSSDNIEFQKSISKGNNDGEF